MLTKFNHEYTSNLYYYILITQKFQTLIQWYDRRIYFNSSVLLYGPQLIYFSLNIYITHVFKAVSLSLYLVFAVMVFVLCTHIVTITQYKSALIYEMTSRSLNSNFLVVESYQCSYCRYAKIRTQQTSNLRFLH